MLFRSFFCILAIFCILIQVAFGFTCPTGSAPVSAVEIQTCSDNEKESDGSCPQGSSSGSNGFNFRLDGSEDAPQFLWGALDEDGNFKSQFYKLYEVNNGGQIVDNSVTELNTFAWTYCSPILNNGVYTFEAYGVNSDNVQITITASLPDSTSASSVKWSLNMKNYVPINVNADLVLFSKYETESGDDSGTEDGGKTNVVVNANSYITTAKTATFNSVPVPVDATTTDNGETGYFIFFRIANLYTNSFDLTLDPKMGVLSTSTSSPSSILSMSIALFVALFGFFFF